QAANGHRLALDGPDAAGLTLALLGTHTAADAGQGVGVGDDLIGSFEVALGHLGDELRDANIHRAAAHAGLVLAVEAAAGLLHGHLGSVAQRDLLEVMVAYIGVLLRHGDLLQTHIRHCISLSLLDHFLGKLVHAAGVALLLLRLLSTVNRIAVHQLVKIHLVAVKVGAVHTGKLHLAAHGDTAAAAHTGAVDHD